MKKFWIILLSLIPAVLLAACAFPGASTPVATTPAPEQPAATQPPVEASPTTPEATPTISPTDIVQPTAVITATQAITPPVETPALRVIKPDGSTVSFSLAQLKQLPRAKLQVGKDYFEGPQLIEVIKAAGVTDFKSATVVGAAKSMTLTKNQINPKVILDFTKKGKIFMAIVIYYQKDWVKEITEIQIQ